MNDRLKYLKTQLSGAGLEGMIVSNPFNIKYLTGLDAEGVLIIAPKEMIFITDSRYIEEVTNVLTIDSEIMAVDIRSLSSYDYENFFMLCENVGIEENYITYADYKNYLEKYKVNLVETDNIIEKQRVVKSEDEISKIRTACTITDETFDYIIHNIKRGMTEKEVAFEIERYMISRGADGLAFDTIVASGAHSSMPHAVPTDKVIEDGDVLLIDMGAKYQGYCSDFTRTVFVGNTDKYKEEYNFVLRQQKQISFGFRDNANIKILIKEAERQYQSAQYSILHAFGHSLGLYIHEEPRLRSNVDYPLKENMVLALEPGAYVAGKMGIRIEDTFLITKNGCEALTKSPKEYTNIELV